MNAAPPTVVPSPEEEADDLTGAWLHLLRSSGPALPWTVAAINFVLMIVTALVTLRNHPNSGDEYAYQISADLFARGKLSVPSPQPSRFFDVVHVVNDGKFYGKYPPGWPAILAAGSRLGVPWLVNPLLATATLFAMRALARTVFDAKGANLSTLLILANPFFIFTGASYFSHTSCLLFATLFFVLLFQCAEKPHAMLPYAAMGLCAGLAFSIRPFTTVVLLALPSAWLAARLRFQESRLPLARGLVLAAVPLALVLGLFLAYNKAQTGAWLLQPFEKYDPFDKPGLPATGADWHHRMMTHVVWRAWELNRWLPLSVLFLAWVCWNRDLRGNPRVRVLLGSVLLLFAGFFCYWGDGGIQYGPRYLYEAAAGIVVLSAGVLRTWRGWGIIAVGVVLILGLSTFIQASRDSSADIDGKRDIYRTVEKADLSHAIVFLKTGSGAAPVFDCTRNGITFDGPVLYVQDKGRDNDLLLRNHPGREAFEYEYDQRIRQGSLRRLSSSGSQK